MGTQTTRRLRSLSSSLPLLSRSGKPKRIATRYCGPGGHAEALAASFRGLREVTDAVLAGADHVTISLDLLLAMGDHALFDQAIVEFTEAMG